MNTSSPKALIIGAGVGGLSLGSYLQMNGFQTEIIESYSLPGGLCTSWKRGDYLVDLTIQTVMGSHPDNHLYQKWEELMDIGSLDFVYFDNFITLEDKTGKQLNVYTDIDRLEVELLEKAPEDQAEIRRFCKALRRLSKLTFTNDKAPELRGWTDKLRFFIKMLPYNERQQHRDLRPAVDRFYQ